MTRPAWRGKLGRLALLPLLLLAAAATFAPAAERKKATAPAAVANPDHRCADWTATRQALFGDLHVHTSLSFDANSLGVRNMPADAYRFARGGEIFFQPYDSKGTGLRKARLARPLDFAAVTDHAELLGELHICQTPGERGYDSTVCRVKRRWPLLAYIFVASRMLNTDTPERYSFCGENGDLCRAAGAGPWKTIRDAAEEAYDRTDACTFTSFVAYEWSGGPGGSMTHRNVIFADEKAPALPISFIDEPTGEGLWRRLDAECAAEGCRYLTIPHNTNLSNGLLFSPETASRQDAERRRRVEPLLEVMQHKGDSECGPGSPDEYCAFEKLPFSRMQEQPFTFLWKKPTGLTFARGILGEGLRREEKLGLNPFRLGMIAATDTHLGAAGLVEENLYPGHGAGGDTSRLEVPTIPDSRAFNPGGLAGVWAEENSRESIWAAMQRREVWATSGPRIVVRFFGGFGYEDGLCYSETFVEDGYAGGVPMGGELDGSKAAGAKPVFAVSALQDAGTADSPGTPLERLQIIKIWLEGGEVREKVVDIAESPQPDDLDPSTCAAPKSGSASLCAQWRDEDYDPGVSTIYYARVLEKPSCRWTGHLCAAIGAAVGADCTRPSTVPDQYEFCCENAVAKVVRERAITSPIWITTGS